MKTLNQDAMGDIDESMMDLQAEAFYDKYADQMSAYEDVSIKSQLNESISNFEIVALGQQLDQFSSYKNYVESQGNLAALGQMPMVAADVITAAVGSSILPLVCSIQPIAEEHSIVYYKQIKASQTGNGYTAGDVIADPLTRDNLGDNLGNLGGQRKTVKTDTVATDVTYTVDLAPVDQPIRPYTVEIYGPNSSFGKDDGNGNILGFGMEGTIVYSTGVIDITLAEDPLDVTNGLTCIGDVDLDSANSIDKIEGSLLTKEIKAQMWALGADVGTMANFAFQNRFGRTATDEVAQDLTTELTRILNTNAIARLVAGAVGSTTWTKAAPSTAVSYAEHKLTFVDGLANAESILHNNSGVGNASRIIAGRTAAATLRGMPDFQVNTQASNSISVYGTYDGIPVIRANGVCPDNEIILVANPQGYFNAPLAYSPFMPLMITDTVQSPSNPFKQTKAAAVWAGMTELNSNLSTKLVIG